MTRPTNRNNIKPIRWLVSLVVMVMLGRFTTRTLQSIRPGQSAALDGFSNSLTSSLPVRMTNAISLYSHSYRCFAFFALAIEFLISLTFFGFTVFPKSPPINIFAFFCLAVLLYILHIAFFAIVAMTIFTAVIFIKFRNGLCFFASPTGFHNLSPIFSSLKNKALGLSREQNSFHLYRWNPSAS